MQAIMKLCNYRRLLLTSTLPLSSSFHLIHPAFLKTQTIHPWHNIKINHALLHQSKDDTIETSNQKNIYQAWTIEDDKLLLKNSDKSIPHLASLLNRGLQGVKARLSKLNDVNNPAYIRLFAQQDEVKSKLIPVGEVLRRLKWDTTFTLSDFTVGYYDRIDNSIHESQMDATNDSIQGKETLFVFALPEHRISYVKYKERVVWDKEQRVDLVFGGDGGENIYGVMEGYDEWLKLKQEQKVLKSQKEKYVTDQLKLVLGDERFIELKEMAFQLQQKYEDKLNDQEGAVIPKAELETFVQETLNMHRNAMIEINNDEQYGFLQNTEQSFPKTELQFIELLSELVSFLPNIKLRELILTEIENTLLQTKNTPSKNNNKPLPKLNEDELEESFIRGSGAGGQKINKTSSKVSLLHKPTNIRVECQETRSLSQNRKIARKRLQLKIEEYLLGSESRVVKKKKKSVEKKAKSKARNRARLKKKKEAKEMKKGVDEEDDDFPF